MAGTVGVRAKEQEVVNLKAELAKVKGRFSEEDEETWRA
jgi:hypothetical protein